MKHGQPNFPEMEQEMADFWEKQEIFKKTLEKDAPKGDFVFYEGPPTANGKPGIHHLESRAFKDVIPRYKTMCGYHVRRKAGWDTHGLPVELRVEKELGLSSKKEIEAFGVEKFNQKCKESVWHYLDDWNKFTKRIGFWLDQENPYVTYDPKYVESLWAVTKEIWDKDLLYKDYKVVPWCPRCGTGLSSHELAQGYADVKDLSVTAKFKVKNPESHGLPENTSILAWTTTPWTLPGNVGLAVGPGLEYALVEKKDEEGVQYYLLAKALVEAHFGSDGYVLENTLKGVDLIGLQYEPLYPFMGQQVEGENKEKLDNHAYRVVAADFVTTTDGTGIVHTAVMYGQDDFELGTDVGLPKHHLVNLDGTFVDNMKFLTGRFVKDEQVAIDIIKDLAHRGLLFSKQKYEHSYPHCWRCKTPVIYYARDSWYIRMSGLRDTLVKENEGIHWEPAHIRDGRFGEWLREVKDWAISRERYWGTPLPIWESEDGERICIGSFEELRSLAQDPSSVGDAFDPHRPFVDDVVLEKDGKTFTRVPEVMDVWFDSGCMPFAQDHYPFGEAISYPADYISEAIDQTRGWFYTLHAVGNLLGRGKAYKNVICLGHILDAEGKKMSKSKGNTVDPWEMIEKYGVDTLRMWMFTVNQPGDSKSFDERTVVELKRKVVTMLWNVKAFYELYGTADGEVVEPASEHVLDQWILARLSQLTQTMTTNMDAYKVLESARPVIDFVADLSQWYTRRSRDRMKGNDEADKQAALTTLRYVLVTLSKLMAPFMPFTADRIYQDLGGPLESVHLEVWPTTTGVADAEQMLADMQTTRAAVTAALEQRTKEKLPVRQPLASVTLTLPGGLSEALKAIVAEEVNVKDVVIQKGDELAATLDTTLTPELLAEGAARELIRAVNSQRKKEGLTIDDRIVLRVATESKDLLQAFEMHQEAIVSGVLATEMILGDAEGVQVEIQDQTLHIQIK